MLLTHILFLAFALLASAARRSGHHHWHHHERSTEVASSSLATLADSPAEAAVHVQKRSPAGEDEDEQDECNDEDEQDECNDEDEQDECNDEDEQDECNDENEEDDITNGQQASGQVAGGAPAQVPSSSSSSSTPPPSPAPGQSNGPVGKNAFYVRPGSGYGHRIHQNPYSNVTSSHAAAQLPPPTVQGNPQGGINEVTNPTAGEGQAQQDIAPAAAPAASSSAPAAAPSTAASGNVDLAAGVYSASFTK